VKAGEWWYFFELWRPEADPKDLRRTFTEGAHIKIIRNKRGSREVFAYIIPKRGTSDYFDESDARRLAEQIRDRITEQPEIGAEEIANGLDIALDAEQMERENLRYLERIERS
jgi:hypothetical protein